MSVWSKRQGGRPTTGPEKRLCPPGRQELYRASGLTGPHLGRWPAANSASHATGANFISDERKAEHQSGVPVDHMNNWSSPSPTPTGGGFISDEMSPPSAKRCVSLKPIG